MIQTANMSTIRPKIYINKIIIKNQKSC